KQFASFPPFLAVGRLRTVPDCVATLLLVVQQLIWGVQPIDQVAKAMRKVAAQVRRMGSMSIEGSMRICTETPSSKLPTIRAAALGSTSGRMAFSAWPRRTHPA